MTALMVTIITLISLASMLSFASPELSWDEADYVPSTALDWSFLWSQAYYNRHLHGPLMMYLAKLGQDVLPIESVSLEVRYRFFAALVGSLSIGFLYWALRFLFRTSHAAALVGSSLLLFSVIRLEEAPIIGFHHLMLACTLMLVSLGYGWRGQPIARAAVGTGVVLGFGVLSTPYVIPVALGWALAVALAGRGWIAWDRMHFKVSWSVPLMLATAGLVALMFWPPAVLQHIVIGDLIGYMRYPRVPTLVGDRIIDLTPRWAAGYWLAQLDAPILAVSAAVISVALWKARRRGGLSSRHGYLAVWAGFLLALALAAHLAGARNLLQFIGVLCLATGALFDEAIGIHPRLLRFASAAVVTLAALNLVWLSRNPDYTPMFATDGYRAFVRENEGRLREAVKAQVYGLPILRLYAHRHGVPIAWNASEMPWTTRADGQIPGDVKYVLMTALVYDHMPPGQPMRRVVAAQWKLAWASRPDHAWELRLYERP